MKLKPLGQEKAWKKLDALAQTARAQKSATSLPQGLLFLGPSGVGKKLAARAFFQRIHCEKIDDADSCGTCASCQKISQDRHSDFIEIAPQGDQILVEDLRDLKKALHFAPVEGFLRLVLIEEAHRLNMTSANSLLKMLEEPPHHTRFILVTHERSQVLPTILSRCQFLFFSPLSNDAIEAVLKSQNLNHSPEVIRALEGSMDRADLLLHPSEEHKLENDLDRILFEARSQAIAALQSGAAPDKVIPGLQRGLRAVALRRRLDARANKKLIALAHKQL